MVAKSDKLKEEVVGYATILYKNWRREAADRNRRKRRGMPAMPDERCVGKNWPIMMMCERFGGKFLNEELLPEVFGIFRISGKKRQKQAVIYARGYINRHKKKLMRVSVGNNPT